VIRIVETILNYLEMIIDIHNMKLHGEIILQTGGKCVIFASISVSDSYEEEVCEIFFHEKRHYCLVVVEFLEIF